MSFETRDLGVSGESFSEKYLEGAGWRILAKNYRIRSAEIDLIAERDGLIAFIEVKTRRSGRYGRPAEAVTLRKQQKIIAAAGMFMQGAEYIGRACRFDVIEVFKSNGEWCLNHIENAFEVH